MFCAGCHCWADPCPICSPRVTGPRLRVGTGAQGARLAMGPGGGAWIDLKVFFRVCPSPWEAKWREVYLR